MPQTDFWIYLSGWLVQLPSKTDYTAIEALCNLRKLHLLYSTNPLSDQHPPFTTTNFSLQLTSSFIPRAQFYLLFGVNFILRCSSLQHLGVDTTSAFFMFATALNEFVFNEQSHLQKDACFFFKFAMKVSMIILLLLYHLLLLSVTVNASIFAMGTVTRGSTPKLSKTWKDSGFEGILVWISDHADKEQYLWLPDLINCTFPNAKITTKEMCDLDFFVNKKTQDEVSEDILKKVRDWYSKRLYSTMGGNGDPKDFDNFVNLCNPSFKTGKIGSRTTPMLNRSHFNKEFTKYCGADAHEDVFINDCFMFYLNPPRVLR